MTKKTDILKGLLVIAIAVAAVLGTWKTVPRVEAQLAGYRFSGPSEIFAGYGAGVCTEPNYNGGADSCISRLNTGQIGYNLGNVNQSFAQVANAPVVSVATNAGAGSIAAGAYKAALTYVTINGGQTAITSTQEATVNPSGGASNIVYTAPIAAAGAAGYNIWLTPLAGATLTEISQTINSTVCTGAFQVNGPLGPGTGPFVCPFGTNATITTVTAAGPKNVAPNIPGTPVVIDGGLTIPVQDSAAYPAGIPTLICNLLPQTTNTTITTIQTMGTCPLAAGIQNSYGKVLHLHGHGIYTSGAQTGTMTISWTEGGITPIAVTSAAITTGGQTNAQFEFDFICETSATGASGTLECHGHLNPQLATAANGTAIPQYNDTNTGASSAINLTAANTVAVAITMTTSTTSATLRDAELYMEN